MVIAVDPIDLAAVTTCAVAAHPGKGYEIVIRPVGFVMRAPDEDTALKWRRKLIKLQRQLASELNAYEGAAPIPPANPPRRPSLFRRRHSLSNEQLAAIKAGAEPALDLSGTELTDTRAIATVSTPAHPLCLMSSFLLSCPSVQLVEYAFNSAVITTLTLSHCGIRANGLLLLAQALPSGLTDLDLSHNIFFMRDVAYPTGSSCTTIINIPVEPTRSMPVQPGNAETPGMSAVEGLSGALAAHTRLARLDMSFSQIECAHGCILAEGIAHVIAKRKTPCPRPRT